jgi:hypothetical protein
MNQTEQIAALTAALPNLDTRSAVFARSLLTQYNSRGTLSVRQWPYVMALVTQANRPAARSLTNDDSTLPADGVQVLRERFAYALLRGTRPSVRVPFGGATYRIAAPSATSSYAGRPVLFVRRNDVYVGRIEADHFIAARDVTPDTLGSLRLILREPVDTLARIGRSTGTCCYCARELTDPRSVHHGYGPICAGHYGLPWDADREVVGATGVVDGGVRAELLHPRAESAGQRMARSVREAEQAANPVPPDQLDDEDRAFMTPGPR